MSVDYSGVSSGIIGRAESEFKAKPTGSSSLGKDAFLTLLVTQMKYQDPLNPTGDKEFLAQLAQFTSLEQLTNINDGIEKLTSATNQQQMFSAANFIGKEVKASGDSLSKSGDTVSKLYYTLPEAATKVTINIMDANGNIVRTVDQGAKAAGEQSFAWDGKDWLGNAQADGVYFAGITTAKSDGTSMMVDTTVTGIVSGVSTDSSGGYVLETQDGRKLSLLNVKGIVNQTS
ncbi:Basal-body rod modification protein FlgD [Fundidesulfovibrio magnetotacticus]|uniref:Basal-body rod modification protein FlgD n=1 Tax=Fundidesulfovibrio magnetotacticus TaxID=2730080 RepID=A0A6V8LRV3_9BACT|nr:flagellar hook capping FlgD N-terminal domain-containing protein [Fundidesulfovibrio magnetotacticus]GFK93058.1 Basal-body rod modification protein FlgD [Fundidesulfovibrio magnetotacticus]